MDQAPLQSEKDPLSNDNTRTQAVLRQAFSMQMEAGKVSAPIGRDMTGFLKRLTGIREAMGPNNKGPTPLFDGLLVFGIIHLCPYD
jgi:hypothetical protein